MGYYSQYLVLSLLILSASICYFSAFQSSSNSPFCKEKTTEKESLNIFNQLSCRSCPQNASCKYKDFTCNDGYLKNKDQCLFTSLSEEFVYKNHIKFINFKKNQNKGFKIKLQNVIDNLGISEKEARAAILYNELFIIDSNNNIIRRPQPWNSYVIRLLFFIFSSLFILVLIKPIYYHLAGFTLSALLYIISFTSLSKLLKGLSLSTYRNDHAVSISFYAPWYSTRLADQMLSFFIHYSNDFAHRFLLNITSNGGDKMNDNDYLWEIAKDILPTSQFSLLKANLDFGATIPSSIFNGFYSDSYTKKIGSNKQYQTDFISYGKNNNIDEAYQNIIYTDIQKDADLIHNLLAENSSFVLRSTPESNGNKSKVRGYGIEMRPFKYSMEYNVKNNEEQQKDAESKINITDQTTLNVPTEFEENISSISFKEIEGKFANYLRENSDKNNDTELLRDITNNWPLYLKSINDTDTDARSILQVRTFYHQSFKDSYLNGRQFSLDKSDAFSFIEMLNEEQTLNDILNSTFNFSDREIGLFTTNPLIDHTIHFFDFRMDLINYFNDIEKDDKYKNWPTNIRFLSNYKRGIPTIRKNVIHLILYFDPLTLDGMNEFFSLIFLANSMFPVTAGILPIFRMNDPLSRKVAFAYYHLTLNNPKDGMAFLTRSFNLLEKDPQTGMIISITEETFARAFDELKTKHKNRKKWSNLNELFTPDSDEYKCIQKVAKYFKDKNISVDTVSANGMFYPAPSNYNMFLEIIYKSFSYIVPVLMNLENPEKAMSNHIIDSIIEEGTYPIVDNTNNYIFSKTINSINLHTLGYSDQLHFLNELEQIEWYNHNSKSVNSYGLILTGSHINQSMTFDEKGYSTLDKFIEEQSKSRTKSQILFAINPSVEFLHRKLLSSIPINNYPLLIINGRIISNFNYTNIDNYHQVDVWNYDFCVNNYPPHLSNSRELDENIGIPLSKFYIFSIINSWRSNSVQRNYIGTYMIDSSNPLMYMKYNENKMELIIVANPFKRAFQRFSGIINYFASNNMLSINMILNPSFVESDDLQTISSFYRNSIDNDDVVFTYLNDRTTYSSIIDVPNSWQAESLQASFDLDNILLSELSPMVHQAEYVLTNIIVEGSCMTEDGNPAVGTVLSITPPNSELLQSEYYINNYASKSDTIVLKPKDGYFQLMGTIGPNVITKSGNDLRQIVEVNSFSMPRTKVVLNGVRMEDLKGVGKSSDSYKNTTRIDVFGVASGHLYERLIKIMMLSVKRQTTPHTKVTFWLLNNFLSPQFKSVLPQMANKYKFDYKLVKYKWPNWIHPQYEKQRIIWGNKILFLDVLFPIDLERVIYIDSDQIVRTDMNELMKMDFNGAPYAFTPFCDSRKETEPFRFWKQGSWKIQLHNMAVQRNLKEGVSEKVTQPLKYHISALFAIDLNRFRKLNGGDILRMNYNALAPDKNSLANLDQDLPNFVQSSLPIFSLPQNWLWCETWCSDETMDSAKTIDLCNNPLTKKPKLEIAKTRIAEWPGLDEEVSRFSSKPDEYEKMFFN